MYTAGLNTPLINKGINPLAGVADSQTPSCHISIRLAPLARICNPCLAQNKGLARKTARGHAPLSCKEFSKRKKQF